MMPLADWSRAKPDVALSPACGDGGQFFNIDVDVPGECDGLIADLIGNISVSEQFQYVLNFNVDTRRRLDKAAEQVAVQLIAAIDRIEISISTELHEVLLPFIEVKIESVAVSEICSAITRLASRQLQHKIACSSPPHLKKRLIEALLKMGCDQSSFEDGGPEIELRFGDTEITSQIVSWKEKLRKAIIS
jgi:hypothetical protein